MVKKYVIWWHSKYIDEINRDTTTLTEIVDKLHKIMNDLEKLTQLEKEKKIKVRLTGSLNPIHIVVVDSSVESEVACNPLVEIMSN